MSGMKDMLGDDLFEPGAAYARRSDPETSHAAAKSMESEATRLEGIVHRAVQNRGDYGATWDETSGLTGLPLASISPRWKPLRKKGLIKAKLDRDGEIVKRPGKSGRGQIVWVAS